ncbi:MAG TPA: hypothetical protein DIV86_00340, partial [Alphaproteobacteria bacterium]|nr:hypothetical protein [Alphaproteobacteria bacterium]
LYGGMGDDYIDGGAGTDEMTGGEGSDMFVFNVDSGVVNIVANPLDGIITDFKDGVDKIMVSDASGGNLSFTDLSITQVGSSVLVTLSSNGDSIEIQNFDAANLDANDFVF